MWRSALGLACLLNASTAETVFETATGILPLKYARFADESNWENNVPSKAIDGVYGLTDSEYPAEYAHSATNSKPTNTFSVDFDLDVAAKVQIVTIYPRHAVGDFKDAINSRYSTMEVSVVGSDGDSTKCTPLGDLTAAGVEESYDTGLEWSCDEEEGTGIQVDNDDWIHFSEITVDGFYRLPIETSDVIYEEQSSEYESVCNIDASANSLVKSLEILAIGKVNASSEHVSGYNLTEIQVIVDNVIVGSYNDISGIFESKTFKLNLENVYVSTIQIKLIGTSDLGFEISSLNVLGYEDYNSNTCFCQFGAPASGKNCPEDGTDKCAVCLTGSYMQGDICLENQCSCTLNGIDYPELAAFNGDCPSNGEEKCFFYADHNADFLKQNVPGYHIDNNMLVQNICSCPNGNEATGAACHTHLEPICASCNLGFSISTSKVDSDTNLIVLVDPFCEENNCKCDFGVPAHGCVGDQYKCLEDHCQGGYFYNSIDQRCNYQTCQCQYGTPANDCLDPTEINCFIGSSGDETIECISGYHDETTVSILNRETVNCVQNECACENGVGKIAAGCGVHTDLSCEVCYPGFMLEPRLDEFNQTIIDDATGVEMLECVDLTCPCTRGTGFKKGQCLMEAIINGVLVENDDLADDCQSCDLGYQLSDDPHLKVQSYGKEQTYGHIFSEFQETWNVLPPFPVRDARNEGSGKQRWDRHKCVPQQCGCDFGRPLIVSDQEYNGEYFEGYARCRYHLNEDLENNQYHSCIKGGCNDYYHMNWDDTVCSRYGCESSMARKDEVGICEENQCSCIHLPTGEAMGVPRSMQKPWISDATKTFAVMNDATNQYINYFDNTATDNFGDVVFTDGENFQIRWIKQSYNALTKEEKEAQYLTLTNLFEMDKYSYNGADETLREELKIEYGVEDPSWLRALHYVLTYDRHHYARMSDMISGCSIDKANQCSDCSTMFNYTKFDPTNTYCIFKTCSCPNGVAHEKHSCFRDDVQCASCDRYHHAVERIDEKYNLIYYTCEPNVCECDNGEAQPNEKCDEHGGNECVGNAQVDSCDNFFHLETDRPDQYPNDIYWSADCVANKCSCRNGTAVFDTACKEDGKNQCRSCDPGFTLDTNSTSTTYEHCIPNECVCENGTPRKTGVTPEVCLVHGRNECYSCDFYYKLDFLEPAPSCIPKVCPCTNGVAVAPCDDESVEQCDYCNNFYHLDDGIIHNNILKKKCPPNECYCDDGTPVPFNRCFTNGLESCKVCDPNFHLENIPNSAYNVCDEYHYFDVISGYCDISCADGYVLLNGQCQERTIDVVKQLCSQNGVFDLVLVMDGSGSVSETDYVHGVEFFQNIVAKLDIGPSSTRVSIMQFSDLFNQYVSFASDRSSVEQALTEMHDNQLKGNTHTHTAITKVSEDINQNGRANVPKIVLFMTDGESTHGIDSVKDLLHTDDITTYAIGVGNGADIDELNAIASDPDSEYVHEITDYSALNSVYLSIVDQVCVNVVGTRVDLEGNPIVRYVPNRKSCEPNDCVCENGIANEGANCRGDGQNSCASCDKYYYIGADGTYGWGEDDENPSNGDDCIPKVCVCANGVADPFCNDHGENECCDTTTNGDDNCCDLHDQNDPTKFANPPTETLGPAKYDVQYFKLVSKTNYGNDTDFERMECVPKECICTNGTPTGPFDPANPDTTGYCSIDGGEMCKSCNPGYHLDHYLGRCVPNECVCELEATINGKLQKIAAGIAKVTNATTIINGNYCKVHLANECDFCFDGLGPDPVNPDFCIDRVCTCLITETKNLHWADKNLNNYEYWPIQDHSIRFREIDTSHVERGLRYGKCKEANKRTMPIHVRSETDPDLWIVKNVTDYYGCEDCGTWQGLGLTAAKKQWVDELEDLFGNAYRQQPPIVKYYAEVSKWLSVDKNAYETDSPYYHTCRLNECYCYEGKQKADYACPAHWRATHDILDVWKYEEPHTDVNEYIGTLQEFGIIEENIDASDEVRYQEIFDTLRNRCLMKYYLGDPLKEMRKKLEVYEDRKMRNRLKEKLLLINPSMTDEEFREGINQNKTKFEKFIDDYGKECFEGHYCDRCYRPGAILDDNLHCKNQFCPCNSGTGRSDGTCNDKDWGFDICESCDFGYHKRKYDEIESLSFENNIWDGQNQGSRVYYDIYSIVGKLTGAKYKYDAEKCVANVCHCSAMQYVDEVYTEEEIKEEAKNINAENQKRKKYKDNEAGEPIDGGFCVQNGYQQCGECKEGYHRVEDLERSPYVYEDPNTLEIIEIQIFKCVPNKCQCNNGEGRHTRILPLAEDTICPAENAFSCGKCERYYTLTPVEGEDHIYTCEPNVCRCDNVKLDNSINPNWGFGEAINVGFCQHHNAQDCVSCNPPYHHVHPDFPWRSGTGGEGANFDLDSMLVHKPCVEKECTCENGVATGADASDTKKCHTHGKNLCFSCDQSVNGSLGYHLVQHEDVIPGALDQMEDYDEQFYFEQSDKQCERNECVCNHNQEGQRYYDIVFSDLAMGTPREQCTEHQNNECQSCANPGYRLAEVGDNHYQCVKNVCQCENGVAYSGDDCEDHLSTDCQTADRFFHRERYFYTQTRWNLNSTVGPYGFEWVSDKDYISYVSQKVQYRQNSGLFEEEMGEMPVGVFGQESVFVAGWSYGYDLPDYYLKFTDKNRITNEADLPENWDDVYYNTFFDSEAYEEAGTDIYTFTSEAFGKKEELFEDFEHSDIPFSRYAYFYYSFPNWWKHEKIPSSFSNRFGYKYKAVPNQCECKNGTAVPNSECEVHGAIQCKECDQGFYLDPITKECKKNVCKCACGTPRTDCSVHEAEECEPGTCSKPGCTFVDPFMCKQNICTCGNGVAQTGARVDRSCELTNTCNEYNDTCEDDASEDCASCLGNYHLETYFLGTSQWVNSMEKILWATKNKCVENVCVCANGEPVDNADCTKHGAHQCKVCDPATNVTVGYHLVNYMATKEEILCEENVCVCNSVENLIGTPHPLCSEHGAIECEDCFTPGYTHNATNRQCEVNVCYCDNGKKYKADECEDHQSEDCRICTGNFHLEQYNATDSRFYADGLNDHEIKYTCEPNKCICTNGTPVDDADCKNHGGEQCKSCNVPTLTTPGYWLVPNLEICNVMECFCDYGDARIACSSHQAHQCENCKDSLPERTYNPRTWQCDVNDCTCSHGNEQTGEHCEDDESEDCELCLGNYHLESYNASNSRWVNTEYSEWATKLYCDDNQCTCPHGVAVRSPEDVCVCANGIAVSNPQCDTPGAHKCQVCDDGYVLINDQCHERTTDVIKQLCSQNGVFDLVLIADGSNSVVSDDYERGVEFFESIVAKLDIGVSNTRVSIFQFSNDVKRYVSFGSDRSIVESALATLKADQFHGATYTHLAIEEAARDITENGRANAIKIVVLMTDGKSTKDLIVEGVDYPAMIHTDEITTYAVGVGDGVDVSELVQIASSPAADYVFQEASYSALNDVYLKIVNKVCVNAAASTEPVDYHIPLECTVHGEVQCESCDSSTDTKPGYYLKPYQPLRYWGQKPIQYCEINICRCDYGDARIACPENDIHQCENCRSPGRTHDPATWQCPENTCTCNNGIAHTGDDCEDHNSEDCEVCVGNYHIEHYIDLDSRWYNVTDGSERWYDRIFANKNKCVENVCVCANGEPVDNADCTLHGDNQCKKCDQCEEYKAGYHLNLETLNCDLNVCHCDIDGQKVGDPRAYCCVHNKLECRNCKYQAFAYTHSSYFNNPLDYEYICKPNGCDCDNGTAFTGRDCEDNNSQDCEECDRFYHLHSYWDLESRWRDTNHHNVSMKYKCFENECQCSNGVAVDNSICEEDGIEQCQSCNQCTNTTTGYHLVDVTQSYHLDDIFVCQENECSCSDGTEREICCGHGTESCQCCDSPGKRTDESTNWTCTQNVCICPNGVAATGDDCTVHGAINCVSCDATYHQKNYTYTAETSPSVCPETSTYQQTEFEFVKCKANGCTCDDNYPGTPVSRSQCINNNQEFCDYCDSNTTAVDTPGIPGATCKKIVCYCENGYGDDETCTNPNDHKCKSCFEPDYELDPVTKTCKPKCACENGTPVKGDKCRGAGVEQCKSCNSGYTLDEEKELCPPNNCTCANGVGLTGGECWLDGGHDCDYCDDYYTLYWDYTGDGTTRHTCRPNKCICDIGVPVPDEICRINNETQCLSCNDFGYFVDPDQGDRCLPKECKCENGKGIHDGTCMDIRMNRCRECDDGYTLEFVLGINTEFHKLLTGSDIDTVDYPAETCVYDPKCSCPNGIAADDCETHNQVKCAICNEGYYPTPDGICVSINTCTCDCGIAAEGANCPYNGAEMCASCDCGYSLTGQNTCLATKCTCDNGIALEDGTCHDSAHKRCISCDYGYELVYTAVENVEHLPYESTCVAIPDCADNQRLESDIFDNDSAHCVTNVCVCPNGQAVDFCPEHKSVNCFVCDAGFHLTEDNKCVPNVCRCDHGAAATGTDCYADGAIICANCYSEGFKLSDDYMGCEPKVCSCNNGHPLTDGACLDENYQRCIVCNPGFELKIDFIDTVQVDSCVPVQVVEPEPEEEEEVVVITTTSAPVEAPEKVLCPPGFALNKNKGNCREEKDTFVLLPPNIAKKASQLELQNGQCLGLIDLQAEGGFGELRPYPCHHPNVLNSFYYSGKDDAIFGKSDKAGIHNKGRACLVQNIDENGKVRLSTVRCNKKPLPEGTDFNKKKGVKRLNLSTSQWYVTPSGEDVKNFLRFPHWDEEALI